MVTPPVVLSIAGFDPSSGAGITADVQTILAHGCFPVTCITALTVQSTQGVRRVEPVRGELVRETLRELARDFDIAAVKVGMLGSREVGQAVADFLLPAGLTNVVLDPIVKSSSGADLIDREGFRIMRERLLPLSTVVTPNAQEAAALTDLPANHAREIHAAARKLHAMGAVAVVITDGDRREAEGNEAIDWLSERGRMERFCAAKIASRSTHGTGCAFSTAIACELAKGKSLREAVIAAKEFVRRAIQNATPLGKGIGPMKLI